MMEKLLVDSVVTWAKHYKVDGFRFDLMGHHMKRNMLKLRASPGRPDRGQRRRGRHARSTSTARAGTSARWPTTPAASTPPRPTWPAPASAPSTTACATACAAADRSAASRSRASSPASTTTPTTPTRARRPTSSTASSSETDWIRVGLAGNLADVPARGPQRQPRARPARSTTTASRPATPRDPQEVITYIEAHDNETLFDAIQLKAARRRHHGRPRAHAEPRHEPRRLRPGHPLLPRRRRAAALEVARPQQLQLRRLVQQARLHLRRPTTGASACRRRRTTRPTGASCSRCWPTRP